jgi:hypothetical protein
VCRLGVVEECFDCGGFEGSCEEESLSEVALFALEALELGLVFDAFAECFHSECFAELDECVHERVRRFAGFGDAGDERAVDFEGVDGEQQRYSPSKSTSETDYPTNSEDSRGAAGLGSDLPSN